jgi:hypothetical protein
MHQEWDLFIRMAEMILGGPLGEITSKAAQDVTRSRGWNIAVRVK